MRADLLPCACRINLNKAASYSRPAFRGKRIYLENRPYSEQSRDRYERAAVREKLAVFSVASAVKS